MSEQKKDPRSAFLIVEGKRAISLERPITSIGRKKDNHIVIKNQHVSRYHAQIRNIKGSYVLMDLEQTVGTSINGKKIKQAFLKDGDVISIGGSPIIFGLGTPKLPLEYPQTGPQNIATGPTDTIKLDDADAYLDLFNTTQKE